MEMSIFGADGRVRQTLPLDADAGPSRQPVEAAKTGARHTLALLYRNDALDWRVAPADEQPDILSELSWRNVGLAGLEWQGNWPLAPDWALQTKLAGASYISGTVQDSDYGASGRNAEFSRSTADARRSHAADAEIGLLYRLAHSRPDSAGVALTTGLAWHRQALRMGRAQQQVSRPELCPDTLCSKDSGGVPVGTAFDTHSSYNADWRGAYLGTLLTFELQPGLTLELNYRYQRLKYAAEANWALREEFAHPISYTHEAWGHLHDGGLALTSKTGNGAIQLEAFFRKARTHNGTDDTRWAEPGGVAAGTTMRLQDVQWRSVGLSLGYRFDF